MSCPALTITRLSFRSRRLSRRIRNLLFLFSFLFVLHSASAQAPATGTPAFGSFGGGPDVINLGNLNVHWTIPIIHKPGRGTDFDYSLTYDSSIWQPVTSGSTKSWQLVTTATVPGWTGLIPAGQTYIAANVTYTSGPCGTSGSSTYYTWTYTNLRYNDASGTLHTFPGTVAYINSPGGGGCPPNGPQPSSTPQPVLALDGSGYTLYPLAGYGGVLASGYVTDKSGSSFYPPILSNPTWSSTTSTDRNGNQIISSNGSYTDTLNQNVLGVIGTAPSNTTLSYTTSANTTASFTVKYAAYTVKTNFGCSGVTEFGPASKNL